MKRISIRARVTLWYTGLLVVLLGLGVVYLLSFSDQMLLRQTRDALTKMGVEEIDPQGKPFDAELMNAVMQGTAEEGEPGTVCMVLQKGYKLGERVIRHAMVKVVAG